VRTLARPHPPRPLHVTIVADNPQTLAGLEMYLRRAGVKTSGTADVEKLSEVTPPSVSVVVVFPDDFHVRSVFGALATLRRHRPNALPVLVTKEPKRFESLPPNEGGVAPLLVPRPAWSWTILDAIRAHLDPDPSNSEKRR